MKLEGKVAIITGAARSIGKAIALRYASEGAKVVVNYLSNPQLAEMVVKDIKANGGTAFAFGADVSKEDEFQRLVEETVKQYGTVDILVNNAGIDPRKNWLEISMDDWDHVMAVNVRSQFIGAKAVFPYMQAQNYGKIINVSSVTFFTGQKNFAHYVASKGAIVGLTRALAREVGEHGITVNCLTPGAILTETEPEKVGSVEAQTQGSEYLIKEQSIKRRMIGSDIEGAFVFLASSDSDSITGQTLNVDGGWVMH